METPSKRLKKSRLLEAIDDIKALDVSTKRYTNEEWQKFAESMMVGLRPSKYPVGNEEEEREYREALERAAREDRTSVTDSGNIAVDESDDNSPDSWKVVILSDGSRYPISEYFGSDWKQLIADLHTVKPLPGWSNMPTTPQDYQPKGAAQIDHACKGYFRGCLIGDPMGLGRTLQAICSMKLIADEPGIILVVCPASLCIQWVQSIENAFGEGDKLSALHLEDPNISAQWILASGYDVLVCSYEFVEAGDRRVAEFEAQIEAHRKDKGHTVPLPKRPTAALHPFFWKLIGVPIKRVYADEAHLVNKREGKRHQALTELYTSSWCLMSDTLARDKWHNLSGYLDFFKGHSFTTDEKFMRQFSLRNTDGSYSQQIGEEQMVFLQRFLEAFLIMRPLEAL